MTFPPCARLPVVSCAALLCLTFAGCETSTPTDNLAEAAAMGERPPAMQGAGEFFNGRVAATITISRGMGRGTGGPGGGGRRGGRGGHHSSRSEPLDVSTMEPEEAESYLRARQAVGSPMPPVTSRLMLENRGTEPVEVEIVEVSSDLGNFAVRPAKLTLAPHQTAEPDPMISQLGITSDEIAVKVILRVAGAKEDQSIIVRSLRVAATPASTK